MSRMATVKETGVELSEDEWRRFEAGVAAELARRTGSCRQAGPAGAVAPAAHAGLADALGVSGRLASGEGLAPSHNHP